MKKKIIIPIELEIEIDERVLGGEIQVITVKKRKLNKKEIQKLFEELQP